MSDVDPFFRLPTELCCVILREWLLLVDIVGLDSAVCNTEKRPLLLNTIFTSSQCIVSHKTFADHERIIFNWVCKRNLRSSGLAISWDVDDSAREYLCSNGNAIQTLEFANCDNYEYYEYMPLINQHCANVTCLIFAASDVDSLIYAGPDHDLNLDVEAEYLRSGLKALDLSMTHLSVEGLDTIFQQCSCITHLMIPKFVEFSDDSGDVLGRNLKHLRYLSASYSYITDEVLIGLAEHCSDTLEEFYIDGCEAHRGGGLNAILRHCTKLRLAQIDNYAEIIGEVVTVDFSLLCNLTQIHIGSLGVTEAFMDSIVSNCTRVQCMVLDWKYYNFYQLEILTAQRLPELKVLAQRGFPQSALDAFTMMRPEVQVDELRTEQMTPNFFDMKF